MVRSRLSRGKSFARKNTKIGVFNRKERKKEFGIVGAQHAAPFSHPSCPSCLRGQNQCCAFLNIDRTPCLQIRSARRGELTMTTTGQAIVIDADAHVVECERTWEFMDPSERQYRPTPLQTAEKGGVKQQFWLVDGKVRGLRFPAFTP